MKRIVAFGDSNTWGLDPATGERFSENVRWTGILENDYLREPILLAEEGLCGRSTVFEDRDRPGLKGLDAVTDVLRRYDDLFAVILMLGTNDCKAAYHASAGEIGNGLERCLDLFEKKIPPERVLVVSPIRLGKDVWKPEKDPAFDRRSVEVCGQLENVYSAIARKRGNLFLAASDYAAPSEADEEHLDADGHRKLAKAIYQKISGWF